MKTYKEVIEIVKEIQEHEGNNPYTGMRDFVEIHSILNFNKFENEMGFFDNPTVRKNKYYSWVWKIYKENNN